MGKSTNVKPVMRGPWGQRSKHFQARPHYLIQIKDFFPILDVQRVEGAAADQ